MTEDKNCKDCIHIEACSKWTDFPKQIGFPVCVKFKQTSDVAREMFEEIERVLALHFGTYTDRDTVMVRDLFRLLNKFAEEEMEGEG